MTKYTRYTFAKKVLIKSIKNGILLIGASYKKSSNLIRLKSINICIFSKNYGYSTHQLIYCWCSKYPWSFDAGSIIGLFYFSQNLL